MLEDILRKYFGFTGEVDSSEWIQCYEQLVSLIYDLERLGVGVNAHMVITRLDEIDTRGE